MWTPPAEMSPPWVLACVNDGRVSIRGADVLDGCPSGGRPMWVSPCGCVSVVGDNMWPMDVQGGDVKSTCWIAPPPLSNRLNFFPDRFFSGIKENQ